MCVIYSGDTYGGETKQMGDLQKRAGGNPDFRQTISNEDIRK